MEGDVYRKSSLGGIAQSQSNGILCKGVEADGGKPSALSQLYKTLQVFSPFIPPLQEIKGISHTS